MTFRLPRSLFARLLLGFTLVTVAIWFAVLLWNIYDTKTERKKSKELEAKMWTEQMLATARVLSDRPASIPVVINSVLDVRRSNMEENGLYVPVIKFQVWQHGRLIYTNDPQLTAEPPDIEPGSSGHAVQVEGSWVGWAATDPQAGITVLTEQEVIGRYILTIWSAAYYLLPLLYSFPFMLLPAFFVIKISLKPLNNIVSQIEERSTSELTPLPPSPYKELSPLVSSVNNLIQRLAGQLKIEQEFLLDAAHELKTPLSVIQANAEGLLNNPTPEEIRQANDGLRQGVARATHTVHQLLALTRSGFNKANEEMQTLDLVRLVRDRLALAANIALKHEIEIELDSPEQCMLPLHRESVALLIDNLIDNAVKYSPVKSRITVSIAVGKECVVLTFNDEGPGIPRDFRKRVFERFYRMPDQDQEGSGLGLAIAERAAERNNGSIRLETGAGGIGLAAIVEFWIMPGRSPAENGNAVQAT